MWAILKSLLTQLAIWKLLLKSLGSLAWLLPLAFILKAIGLPVLMLLAVLALPLLLLLFVIGLPIILVIMMGGALLSLTMVVLSIGVAALKIALPIALIWIVLRWLFKSRDDKPPMAEPPPDVA